MSAQRRSFNTDSMDVKSIPATAGRWHPRNGIIPYDGLKFIDLVLKKATMRRTLVLQIGACMNHTCARRTIKCESQISKTLLVLMLIVGFTCSAEAQSEAQTAYAQTAKLTFFRPAGYWARLHKFAVYCDGKEVAKLSDRTKLTVSVSPGTHQCYEKTDARRHTAPLVFELNIDEHRFVEVQYVTPSSMFDGTRPQLTLQKPGWVPDENNPNWRELRVLK